MELDPTRTPFDSLAHAYRGGSYAPFVQAVRLAGSASVPLVRFAQPAGTFPDPPTPDYTLAINEHGSGRMRFDIGLGRQELPFRRGDLVLKPPGVATFFANDAPHRKSFVSLAPALLEGVAREALDGATPDFGPLHRGAFRSPAATGLLELIWAEAALDGPEQRLFGDGALMSLVATLLRLSRPGAGPARLAAAGLQPARLARVRAFVEENLAEAFGLAGMAAAAGLSPFHFSRAFKAATGQTPRGYVAARRMDRAKELLAGTALPLAEIAQGCGFADQAHFTHHFRRQTGCTPGAWRKGQG